MVPSMGTSGMSRNAAASGHLLPRDETISADFETHLESYPSVHSHTFSFIYA